MSAAGNPPDPGTQGPQPPIVGILMAVYNGAPHLREQLDSIADQDHAAWHILASDDGSQDISRDILDQFRERHAQIQTSATITRLDGPGQGGAANFLSLIRRAPDHLPKDSWLAFCDQDDVWLSDRLSRGIAALRHHPAERPALYCSRSWITDVTLQNRRLSAPRPRDPSFRNALVQNITSGNTILLNPAAARLVTVAAHEIRDVVVHDWWIYQLITGVGGKVVHDDTPTLLYRQHGVNQIGANDSARARLKRLHQLLRGDFRTWNTVNIAALQSSAHRLTACNRTILDVFATARTASLPRRLLSLSRLRLYRQTRAATGALWVAAVLGRL